MANCTAARAKTKCVATLEMFELRAEGNSRLGSRVSPTSQTSNTTGPNARCLVLAAWSWNQALLDLCYVLAPVHNITTQTRSREMQLQPAQAGQQRAGQGLRAPGGLRSSLVFFRVQWQSPIPHNRAF